MWLAAHYIALLGCAVGYRLTGDRAALVLISYNFAAFAVYRLTGVGMPVELFRYGDVVASALILGLCPLADRKIYVIVAGYGLCILLYDRPEAFNETRAISIMQFLLCWPWLAKDWAGWLQRFELRRKYGRIDTRVRRTSHDGEQ